jgi:hypothetical protein
MRGLVFAVTLGACGFSNTASHGVDGSSEIDAPSDVPRCFGARCRRITLTIDPAKVVGAHASFPLLVRLTDPDFANAAGPDLVFTAADGVTPLPYERELLTVTDLAAWVLLPSLASTAPTPIHLYYGDPAAADTQNRPAVWDAGYQAVYHLTETTGALLDSTARANHGTAVANPMRGVRSHIATGVRFDGVDDCIQVTQSSSLTSAAATATLSMWVNFDLPTSTTYQRLLMSGNTFANDFRGMEWATNNTGFYYYYPADAGQASNNYIAVATPFVAGQWHYVVLTQDFATKTVKMAVDGAIITPSADNTPTNWLDLTTASDWYWGGSPGRTRFVGVMDEIRVSNTVRSPEWIATEFANQSSPSTFYAVSQPLF